MKNKSHHILWITNINYKEGLLHGGNLRILNLAKELTLAGHKVFILNRIGRENDGDARLEYFNQLIDSGYIESFFEISYNHPVFWGRISHLLISQFLINLVLSRFRTSVIEQIDHIANEKNIDICIFTDRTFLFSICSLSKKGIKTVIDWVDSEVLYQSRQIKIDIKHQRIFLALKNVKLLLSAFQEERYYGRKAELNLTVSPVDNSVLNRVNSMTNRNKVLLNGSPSPKNTEIIKKIPNQLIFSGVMNFPPNVEAATWLTDHIMPILRKHGSHRYKLLIAGAYPTSELLDRQAEDIVVTGFVEDMSREIAQSSLYVAPLKSGGGFKNKVVEAIASGTYVVASSKAVEFLESEMQTDILVTDDPEIFAKYIMDFMEDPYKYNKQLGRLQSWLKTHYSWKGRAAQMETFIQESH